MEYTPNLELEKLRTEKEQNEKKIEQLTHKITRLENRQKYLEDGERKRRTHRLCTIAGTLESIAPAIKELEITEVMELLEYVFHKDDVQQAVSRVKKAHDLKTAKRRRDKYRIISFPCRSDQTQRRSIGCCLRCLPGRRKLQRVLR